MALKVTCRIRRQMPGESPRWVDYVIEIVEGGTVLDLLRAISRRDQGLAFTTHHCKVGVCGGCNLLVDGRKRLACRTLVKSSSIRLEPLPGAPLIQDLLVDLFARRKKLSIEIAENAEKNIKGKYKR